MKLFNTLTNKKEEFKPLKEGEVSIYVCGPTVYNYVHIGNTRPMIVFDVLRRTFEYLGNKVTFVSNFTDVDDKIIKAAKQEGITEKELTDKYIDFNMYYSLIDSLAAEHSARMQAMEAASKNAKEKVNSLTVEYNKARQAAITTELIEIISGVEALK